MRISLRTRLSAIVRRMPVREKIWMGFFLTSLVPLAVLGVFVLVQIDRERSRDLGSRMEREVAVRASRVSAKLSTHWQTLDFLAHLPSLQRMLAAQTPEDEAFYRSALEQNLAAMSEATQVYQQIRFIDRTGMEKVRVDHRNRAQVVPEENLQNKADRPYFRETVLMPPGGVYVSPVELNQEYGRIEQPHFPVLRLGTPIFQDGELRGILILNIAARSFLEDPVDSEPGTELFALKPDGSYVWHPVTRKAFGGPGDLNTGEGIYRDYPDVAEYMLTYHGGITRTESGRLVAFVRISPSPNAQTFLVLALTKEGSVLAGLSNPMLWGTLALILAVALVARWAALTLAKHIVQPIELLRGGVARLRHGDLTARVSLRSEDELAVLADDINHMAAELEDMYLGLEEKVAERTRSLQEMHRRLQESDRHKSQFLATTSHELRTPLTAVIGFAEDLADGSAGPLTDRQQRYAAHILSSARHLLRLINDLLDLSKIEAGRMSVTLEPTHVAPLTDEVLSMMNGMAASQSVRLVSAVPGNIVVMADRERLKQVLLNLLSNALKFTPADGQVRVEASLHEGWVRVAVSDTGIGIQPADQERIFRDFEQVDNRLARRTEGTGLGLPLSRRLVELMGGSIGLQSAPGEGSCFWFLLPPV